MSFQSPFVPPPTVSTDQTNLFKTCVKTIRAKAKNEEDGISIPPSRIFPVDHTESKLSYNDGQQKFVIPFPSKYFSSAREIEVNINKYRQLILDHRIKYIGKVDDPESMSIENCIYLDKVSFTVIE